MDSSNKLVDLIREISKDSSADIDRSIICYVDDVNADGTLNIKLPSDIDNIIKNVPNNSPYTFKSGDYALLYKIGNKLNNSFVLTKVTKSPPDIKRSNDSDQNIIVTNNYSGGGGSGGGTSVYVAGVEQDRIDFSSDPQTQISGKQPTITGGASTITSSNLSANFVLASNDLGKVVVSNISTTELEYLDGVTSNIQDQLDTKANSSSLANVATSGSYNDLVDTPTIPTVNNGTLTIQRNGVDLGNFSANQGSNVSVNISVPTKTSDLTNDGDGSSDFATESFVNSSVATNTAYFRGTYDIVVDLGLTTSATESQIATALAAQMVAQSITPTNNDYCFVAYPDATDPTQYTKYDRYKYDGSDSLWEYEYTLNNSSFTAEQWAAINSGITSNDATQITTNKNDISGIKDGTTIDSFSDVETALSDKVDKNSAITGSTKCKITYDSKGLVTSGADLQASDIPNLDANKVTSGTFDAVRIPSLPYLSDSTKYGESLYVNGTSISLKDQDGTVLSTITTQDTNDNQTIKGNGVSFGINDSIDIKGDGIISVVGNNSSKDITISASHQSIKSIDTNNSTTLSVSDSESVAGSGIINLHKISKTGSYNDLLDKPTIPTDTNQTIKTSSTTFGVDDAVEIVAGSNVQIDGNASDKTIIISATDTTYTSKAASQGGTDVSLVTTGEKYVWDNKQNALASQTAYTSKGTSTKVPTITTNNLGQVTTISETNIAFPVTDVQVNGNSVVSSGVVNLVTKTAYNATTNQITTEDFVNSSIATNTANFIGTFADIPSLNAYSGTITNNDYAFVINSVITDNGNDFATFLALNAYDKTLLTNFDYAWVINGSKFDLYRFDIVDQVWDLRVQNTDKASVTLNTAYNRYKAVVTNNTVTWGYEYTLNNSSFTASQWAAINSGITSGGVTQITTNKNNIANIKDGSTIDSFGDVETTLQGYLPLSGGAITGLVDATAGTLKIKAIQALTGSSTTATTYGLGTSGQVLKSNGLNVYWATDTSNNNAYYLQSYYFTPNAGAEAIYRYKLVALDKDNRAVPITITDQSNTTMVEKTPTSVAFKPWKIFQYNATTTVAAGGALASHTLQETYNANPVYNFNTTISAKRLVYLCGTFDRTTGLFTLDTTMNASNQYRNYYVQVPTNTANITLSSYFTSGKDYILVGGNYGSNTTNLQLFVCNPMYHFDGTNLLPYDTYNASRIESAIPTVNNGTLTIQLNGSNVQTFTANQSTAATANIQALPNFSLNISHQTAGNPRQVKFLTIDYNTKATYFKMSATSCHDNGTSYQFLEDIIIGCTTGGSVVCNVYKYCQASVTLDSVTRNYGDVFYVIDTTNKLVDFYILCGQYATSQFTPATKIGNTTIQYITQYTGTAVYYSTGTKVWANGNSTTYATLADIGSCYSATNPPPYPVTSVNGATGAITGLAVTNADNNFSAKQTFTAGVKISGRYVGGGDDEGLIIAPATNNYAGVCCGTPSGRRAVFYLKPSAASANSVWRYNNGSTTYDIAHPEKSGTIALTSDIPAAKYMHTVRISIPSSGGVSGNLYFSYISNTSTAITTMTDLMTDIPTGRGYIFGVGGEKMSSSPSYTHVINYCYKKSDTTFAYDAVLFSSSYPYGTWITDSTILSSKMSLSSDTVVSI